MFSNVAFKAALILSIVITVPLMSFALYRMQDTEGVGETAQAPSDQGDLREKFAAKVRSVRSVQTEERVRPFIDRVLREGGHSGSYDLECRDLVCRFFVATRIVPKVQMLLQTDPEREWLFNGMAFLGSTTAFLEVSSIDVAQRKSALLRELEDIRGLSGLADCKDATADRRFIVKLDSVDGSIEVTVVGGNVVASECIRSVVKTHLADGDLPAMVNMLPRSMEIMLQ